MTKLPDRHAELAEILIKTEHGALAREIAQGHSREDALAQRGDRRIDRADQVRQGRRHPAAALPRVQPVHVLPERASYEYTATKTVLTAGSFYCNPKGNVHGPAIAHEETVVVEIYDGPHYPEKPSWYTDERDAH